MSGATAVRGPRGCHVRSHRTGKPCGAQAIKGEKYCRHHGGTMIRASRGGGPNHPSWKTGRYSRYAKMLGMPPEPPPIRELLNPTAEIAVYDALIAMMLAELTGEAASLSDLRDIATQLQGEASKPARKELLGKLLKGVKGSRWTERGASNLMVAMDARSRIAGAHRKQVVSEMRAIKDVELEAALKDVDALIQKHAGDDPVRYDDLTAPIRRALGMPPTQDDIEREREAFKKPLEIPLEFDTPE